MQAPKDGDAWAEFEDLKAMQGERKGLDEVAPAPPPDLSFVTRNNRQAPMAQPYPPGRVPTPPRFYPPDPAPLPSAEHDRGRGASGAFTRGLAAGLNPFGLRDLRIERPVDRDAVLYRLGEATTAVAALEVLQATDPEAFGRSVGNDLRDRAIEALNPGNDPEVTEAPEPRVLVPQVLGWSGGNGGVPGRLDVDVGGRGVTYVPEALLHNARAALSAADGMLSNVLHEMAGEASLCWSPRPAGVFESGEAVVAVERAIERLRTVLRSV